MNADPRFVPHADRFVPSAPPTEAALAFHEVLRRRRTVRHFADRPVERATIEALVRCATTAPNGANKQPWRFVCVQDAATKRRIREGAEREERAFYARRANGDWLDDVWPLGTDANKEFLTTAPWLVAVFYMLQTDAGGQVYYPKESVGIACGMFLAAAQMAGLATLTHTPSPMGFLREILGRPDHERPFLLIPVGHPADECMVPVAASTRRSLAQSMVVV